MASFITEQKTQKPQFIFVLGGPGAGKGTQCAKMVEKFGFRHLSTGDILRNEIKSNSEEAQQISEIIKQGQLVPSELLVNLVKKEVHKYGNYGTFLLDGFPRNQENMDVWNEIMQDTVKVRCLLVFECSEEVMEERLLGRAKTSGRSDDNIESIKKRFKTFQEQTIPIMKKFRGTLIKVDAQKSVEKVFDNTQSQLQAAGLVTHKLIKEVQMMRESKPYFIFVSGGPGCGKGTQCQKLVEKFKFRHLSMNELVSQELKFGSKSQQIDYILRQGQQIPSDILIELVQQTMQKYLNFDIYLLDGFPETQENLNAWDEKMKDFVDLKFFLYLECEAESMEQRLLNRGDDEENIKMRLLKFEQATKPMIQNYQGLIEKVNGEKDLDQIFNDIQKIFLKHQIISHKDVHLMNKIEEEIRSAGMQKQSLFQSLSPFRKTVQPDQKLLYQSQKTEELEKKQNQQQENFEQIDLNQKKEKIEEIQKSPNQISQQSQLFLQQQAPQQQFQQESQQLQNSEIKSQPIQFYTQQLINEQNQLNQSQISQQSHESPISQSQKLTKEQERELKQKKKEQERLEKQKKREIEIMQAKEAKRMQQQMEEQQRQQKALEKSQRLEQKKLAEAHEQKVMLFMDQHKKQSEIEIENKKQEKYDQEKADRDLRKLQEKLFWEQKREQARKQKEQEQIEFEKKQVARKQQKIQQTQQKLESEQQIQKRNSFSNPPMFKGTLPQIVFVLGGPGAGKGTQCEKMVKSFGFRHLSAGDLLRNEIKSKSKEAQQIDEILKQGKLVSSEILVNLIKKEIKKQGNGQYLIDGFPRSQENMDVWIQIMQNDVEVRFLLLFECGFECMEQRLLGRAQTSGRSDDNPETIKKRFQTFQQQTIPIIQNYKGNVEKINAETTVEEVFYNVTKVICKYQMQGDFIKQKEVAIILTGCGFQDGTEVTEAVSIFVALNKNNIKFKCFAQNSLSKDTINHVTQEQMKNQKRNIMEESARICREKIYDLQDLQAGDFDGLIIPGGQGLAKNLSNIADGGDNFIVSQVLDNIIIDFYQQKKPIAACCIASLVLSKVLGYYNIEITMGKLEKQWPFFSFIKTCEQFGCKHVEKDVTEVHVDKKNFIVSSPAFLKQNASFAEVFEGLSNMINQFSGLLGTNEKQCTIF